METDIPRDSDWGAWEEDLDQKSAYQSFAGKRFEEFLERFRDNAIELADELRFMPKKPFQYYIFSFKHYLHSDFSKNDADAASSYMRLIREKFESQQEYVLPIIDELLETAKYVADNQGYFDADIDIYGDFQADYLRLNKIRNAIKESLS